MTSEIHSLTTYDGVELALINTQYIYCPQTKFHKYVSRILPTKGGGGVSASVQGQWSLPWFEGGSVCLWSKGGCLPDPLSRHPSPSRHPPGRCPPWADTPLSSTGYDQQAVGTDRIGMHSCPKIVTCFCGRVVSKIHSSTLILTCLWTSKRVLTKSLYL